LAKRGIENVGVGWLAMRKAVGFPWPITLNLTSPEVWSVIVIAHRAQTPPRSMKAGHTEHHEHRCVWSNCGDLIERRNAASAN